MTTKNINHLIIDDLSTYILLILIFLLVGVFSTDWLRDTSLVDTYVTNKLGMNELNSLGFTIVSIFLIVGSLSFIQLYILKNEFDLLKNVVKELPRIFYLFGAHISSSTLLTATHISLYNLKEPEMKFYFVSFFFGFLFFVCGFFFSYFINRKSFHK